MIPDQYSPNVHLFTEAISPEVGEELHNEYKDKINQWIEEGNWNYSIYLFVAHAPALL